MWWASGFCGERGVALREARAQEVYDGCIVGIGAGGSWVASDSDLEAAEEDGEEAADRKRARIWYPAFRAGYTRRGLVSARFRRKARRMRCLMGLEGPQAVARSLGSWTWGAWFRSAR